MRPILIFACLLLSLATFSQNQVDSLLRLCEKANDIHKTALYLELAKITIKDSALSNAYNQKALKLAVANNQLPEQAKSAYYSAKILFTSRDFTQAIKHYEKAIPLFRQLKDTMMMTTCYSYIGISNFHLSKSKEAITAYLEGLKLSKNDPDYSAELLANIGLVHDEMDNFSEAIKYFRRALALNQSIRDTGSMAIDYDYLGAAYARMKMPDSAVVNYRKALNYFKATGKEDRYAVSLSNIATVFPNYPDSLEKAIIYFNLAWKKFQELGWLHYEADILQGIGNVLVKEGKFDEAISYYNRSLEVAIKFKRELLLKKLIYKGLSDVYEKKRDYKRALENHILFSQYNDSVFEEQRFDQITNLEKQYETEKKDNEIHQLEARQLVTNIQLQKNKELKLMGFVTAALLLFLIFYILFKYFDKIRVNRLLEEKNKQIEASENELRKLNAAKNKFFSIIAHDLKNPLHTILGYSDLLSREYGLFNDTERHKFASDINLSTNNLYRLLQNLLDWSKTQTGRLSVKPMEVEVKKLIESAISVHQPMANHKKIDILVSGDTTLKVIADPQMIETVVRNLLNNAIKFTPENGLIKLTVTRFENKVVVNVKDNGIGISHEEAENLFKIDSKVKRKGTNNEDGSGLGLILCKEFIEINHGTIQVSSAPNQGSTFTFTLPVVFHENISEKEAQTIEQASA